MTSVDPVSISSPGESLQFIVSGENFYQVSSMVLKASVEADGQVVDEINENCSILSDGSAVVDLGDIPDPLTFRAQQVTAEFGGESIVLWSNE